MATIKNGPVRPPLKPAPQPSGSGNRVSDPGGAQIPTESTGGTREGDSPHRKPASAVSSSHHQPRRPKSSAALVCANTAALGF